MAEQPKRKNIDARSRLQWVLLGIVGLLVSLFLLKKVFSGSSDVIQGGASINTSVDVDETPGSFDQSPQYARLQEADNARRADRAKASGSSALPTLVKAERAKDLFQKGKEDCTSNNPLAGRPVFDASGNMIGTVDENGNVYSADGKFLGTLGPDGVLRSADGKELGRVGRVVAAGTQIYDENGQVIGTVGPDGLVRDASGRVLGTLGPDGVLRDSQGKVLGVASGPYPPATAVYDENGRLIGMVGPDGVVRDASGKAIGRVDADGKVRDASGRIIGQTAVAARSSIAPGTPVYDESGKLIGTVGADGLVRDSSGKVIGKVGADGVVRDLNGAVLGKAKAVQVPAGTPVYDQDGKLLGTVGPDGKVRDAEGRVIGEVGADGLVRDAQGKVIGMAAQGSVKEGMPAPGTPVYDASGKLIGTVGADGLVRDAQGKVIGTIGPDGKVRDRLGHVVGAVAGDATSSKLDSKEDRPVYDASGKRIGTVGADGLVRDAQGKVIGKVGPDGVVRDLLGREIGKVADGAKNTQTSPLAGRPVYDAQGRVIGVVGADGVVRDAQGRVVGTVGSDGLVRDPNGNIIARLDPKASAFKGKIAYDANGKAIGMIGEDGLVRDANGKVIGVAGADGLVRDAQGRIVGRAADSSVPKLPGQPTGAQIQDARAQVGQMFQLQQAAAVQKENDVQIRQVQQLMASQAGQLFGSWVSPQQVLVQGQAQAAQEASGGGAAANGPSSEAQAGKDQGPMVAKAGEIHYAVLDTAVNTDEPGPVLASVVGGPFKGARLIGQLAPAGFEASKVTLSFNLMTLPGVSKSFPISAVAVDPNTSRTAFSSYTNRHLVERYGMMFASSFIAGLGQSISQSGATVTQNLVTGNTLVANPAQSTIEKVLIALGNVGQQMSGVWATRINRPPTIHVKSGLGMGILFLNDVYVPKEEGSA